MILLSSKNEDKLEQNIRFLKENNINFVSFREPDIGFQLTAVATEPIYNEKRNLFRRFQLLRPKGGVQ